MELNEALDILRLHNDAGQTIPLNNLMKIVHDLPVSPRDGTKLSLAYSGNIQINPDLNVGSYVAAEGLSQKNSGKIHTIGQTDLGKFLASEEFESALESSAGSIEYAEAIFNGTTDPATGKRLNPGLWDMASEKYIKAIEGPVRFIGPDLSDSAQDMAKVFTQTEIGAILDNPKITTIDGVPRQHYVEIYENALKQGLGVDAARLQVRESMIEESRLAVGNIHYRLDPFGKIDSVYRNTYAMEEMGGMSIASTFGRSADVAKNVDRYQIESPYLDALKENGKHAGFVTGAAIGLVAGATTLIGGGNVAEAGQVTYETAMPYGETQILLAKGNIGGAGHSATIETASNVASALCLPVGAAAGGVVGSVVPVAGTTVGAGIGGLGLSAACGIGAAHATEYTLNAVDTLHAATSDMMQDMTRKFMKSHDPDDTAPPEVQSLHAFIHHPERFENQFNEVNQYGSMQIIRDYMTEQLCTLQTPVPVQANDNPAMDNADNDNTPQERQYAAQPLPGMRM